MDLGITDRVALVTGASAGLGFACAQRLLQEGVRVAITSSNAERIAAARERLPAASREACHAGVLDLTDPAQPAQAVAEAERHFGAPPTLLVVSTGGPPGGSFASTDDAAWERGLDLVLRGFVRLVRAAMPGMEKARFGRVVAITSIAAREPIDGLLASSALRAGLHGLVNALSREVGVHGITVNALMPGYTRTERVIELADKWAAERGSDRETVLASFAANSPLGRMAEPDELAAAAAWLCSVPAAAISGVALPVDGGTLASI